MKYTVTGVWDHRANGDARLIIAGVVTGDGALMTAGAAPSGGNGYAALVEADSPGEAEALVLADVAGDADDLLARFGLDLHQPMPENRDSQRHQNWLGTLRHPLMRHPEIGGFLRSVEDRVLPVHMSN